MTAEPVVDPFTLAERACLVGADVSLRHGGTCPPPQIHLFVDDWDPPYVGCVRTRPYRAGADAVEAIRRLGLAAAAIDATAVLVVWEADDLRASLGEPGRHDNGLVCVLAFPDGTYGLHWHPYMLCLDETSPATDVLPPMVPEWGVPQSRPDVEVPAVVRDVLDLWRHATPDPHELFPRLEAVGYSIDWFVHR